MALDNKIMNFDEIQSALENKLQDHLPDMTSESFGNTLSATDSREKSPMKTETSRPEIQDRPVEASLSEKTAEKGMYAEPGGVMRTEIRQGYSMRSDLTETEYFPGYSCERGTARESIFPGDSGKTAARPVDGDKTAAGKTAGILKKSGKRFAGTVRNAGSAVGSTVKAIEYTGSRIAGSLRIFCAVLMAFLTVALCRGFWTGRQALGTMAAMLPGKNYDLAIYFLMGLFLAGAAALETIRILLVPLRRYHGRRCRIDRGRGFFPFLLLLLLPFAAEYLLSIVPEGYKVINGIRQGLLVVDTLGVPFLFVSLLGVCFSFARWILSFQR